MHDLLVDKVHYASSSAYYIEPKNVSATPSNPHVIPFEIEDLDDEEPLHQWYFTKTSNNDPPTSQSRETTPTPTRNMAWSKDTKPPAANQANQSASFKLGMDLMYRDLQGNNTPVVYEGANADGFLHTDCFEDGAKLTVHDSNLEIIDQPDLSNMHKTPLDYINEIGNSLLLEEA